MAAPITHIVLTEKIFDKFFKDKIRKEFFIGTLFPDIRYLKVIDRQKTHYNHLTIADIRNDRSFLSGVKFHSVLDITREKFVVANDIYSLCPQSKYITQSLKILEDELCYKQIKHWDIYIDYLNDILPEERSYDIAENDLRKWHNLLQRYFKKKPNPNTVKTFMSDVGLSEEIAHEINQNIDIMKGNQKIIQIIENLFKHFDSLIK